jgi:hypothetical protein
LAAPGSIASAGMMQITLAPPRCAVIVTKSIRVRTLSTEMCRVAFFVGRAGRCTLFFLTNLERAQIGMVADMKEQT